ncbi:MAG: efflux transporter outer membrane subunit [Planctomycetota bacterium]
MSRHAATLIAATLSVTLAGCRVGPNYVRPEFETDAAWAGSGEALFNQATPETIETWWLELGDPVLTGLIEEAFESNLDLATAFQNVRRFAALRGRAVAELFPDIDGTGSYSWERAGANGFPQTPNAESFETASIGGVFGWELDVWGRIGRLVESADADLAASVEDLRDVRVLIAAQVATDYVRLRTAQARREIAERNIEIQSQSLELTQVRANEGAAPRLDVAQAETNLATTQAELPSIDAEIRDSLLSLAVLLGKNPTALLDELAEPTPIPMPPTEISVGIPVDVIRRRPDVRSAERVLAAETARIGVETADLLPRFVLSGSFQYSAADGRTLFESNSYGFGFGPSFNWNLFNAGGERADIRAQEAAAEIAFIGYRASVLDAIQEVESSLYRHARQVEQTEALARASTAAAESAELSKELYLEGRTDFQNVLDSERQLFAAEDGLIQSQSDVTTTYIVLQRSLGGGWSPSPRDAESSDERAD